jgi:hypothetical protein
MLINNPFAQTAYTIFAPNSKNSIVFKMREINRLFDEVLSDRSNYNTEEFKRRTEAVFGKRIDKFGEIVTAYYEGGGLRKQDSTLKFYKGNIEYGHGFIKSVQGMIQKEFNDIYPTNPLIGKSVEQQKADYDKALSGMRLKMTGLKVQAQDIARELTKINKQLADGQITKEQHAQLKTDAEEKASENSAEVESLKKLIDKPFAPVPTSVTVDIANTASSKLIGAAKMTKAGLGIGNKILSDWLFEDYIPKVKFAVFALEYAQKLEANPTADATMRHAMAVDSIQFNEQRFGEMNWNNLWMNRSLKTALQLVFRSFTWQYGTFMAIGQGIKNINDAGVFQIKRVFGKQGEMKISLNEKGYWLISAITTHIFTVTMFQLMLKAFGVNKDDEDDKKDFITDSMFLYVGDQKRMAIPSYPDKLYKIVMHIVDAISYKDPAEITKIFSGAINGVTNTMMSMYLNENLGRRIYDPINDSTLKSAALLAMFAVTSRLPISVQTASKSIAEGNTLAKSAALGAAGFTPAGKHAQYTKLEQYLLHSKRKAPPVAEDKYDHKTDLLRAAKGIEKGDKSYIAELKKKGKLSVQDLKEIRSRAKVINGVKNPLYVDMKSRLMKQADLETAYKAFEVAKRDSNISRGELLKLRAIIIAKEANLKPKEVSPERRLALKKLKESLGGNKLLSISA